jgi:hypothetical protein
MLATQVALNYQTPVAQLNASDPEPPNISNTTELVAQRNTFDPEPPNTCSATEVVVQLRTSD